MADSANTTPDTRGSSTRTEWLLFASVMALALVVRLVCFVGIVRLDMFRYVELSNHVLSGGSLFDKNVFYASSRLTLLAPQRVHGHGRAVAGSHASPAGLDLLSAAARQPEMTTARRQYVSVSRALTTKAATSARETRLALGSSEPSSEIR